MQSCSQQHLHQAQLCPTIDRAKHTPGSLLRHSARLFIILILDVEQLSSNKCLRHSDVGIFHSEGVAIQSCVMDFLRSPGFSSVADDDDIAEWSFPNTDAAMSQCSISPPRVAPGLEADATINPAMLLLQHEDLETCPNAAPIQQS